jgi:hypothetical protein
MLGTPGCGRELLPLLTVVTIPAHKSPHRPHSALAGRANPSRIIGQVVSPTPLLLSSVGLRPPHCALSPETHESGFGRLASCKNNFSGDSRPQPYRRTSSCGGRPPARSRPPAHQILNTRLCSLRSLAFAHVGGARYACRSRLLASSDCDLPHAVSSYLNSKINL